MESNEKLSARDIELLMEAQGVESGKAPRRAFSERMGKVGEAASVEGEPPRWGDGPSSGEDPPLPLFTYKPPEENPAELKELISTLLVRERARVGLIDFCQMMVPSYKPFPVHRLIARKLEDVEAGRTRRLALFLPPATGKSRLASELFPAWVFGRNPEIEFIQASYDYALARNFGRSVRNLIKDPNYELVFPGVGLAPDATAMDEWKTGAGGEYKAEGVGGGLVGFHGHIAVIDDPFKNYEAAASPDQRESVWNWYTGVLLNRLRSYKEGPGSVILIMQRWHDDDLGGRVEKLMRDQEEAWEIVSLPSFAEEGDPLGRAVGEPLLPDGPNRRTVEELTALRARNPMLFMALHQQKPIRAEGDMFRDNWLRVYGPEELPKRLNIYMSTDYALSSGVGDYTVLITFGVCQEGHIWILDVWRSQCDVLEAVERTVSLMLQHRPIKLFLEKVSLAKVFGPLLQKRRKELSAWTVVEEVSVVGRGSKESPDRAGAIAGALQLGYIHVPLGAPWLGDFRYELSTFPNGKHDDQVDALALVGIVLDSLRGRGREKVAKAEPLKPRMYTFDEARMLNTRRRLGLPVSVAAPLVAVGEPSPLDEGYALGAN